MSDRWVRRLIRLAAALATVVVVFVGGVLAVRALPLDRGGGWTSDHRTDGARRLTGFNLTIDPGVSVTLVRRPAGEPLHIEAEHRYLWGAPHFIATDFDDGPQTHAVVGYGGCPGSALAQFVNPCRSWVRVWVPDGVKVTAILMSGNRGLTADDGIDVERTDVP